MKVKIKDLEPNPFREWENFQLHRPTVEMLKDSIQETFFWENLIGRKNNGKFELGYGHHRLQALRELYPEGNKMFDIPIYPLNDEQMFIIMARENETGKSLTISNIDLTVKKAKEFLEANPEIHRKYSEKLHKEVGYVAISRFLKWDITRVKTASERLSGYEGKGGMPSLLDKEAVESLPSERATHDFVRAVKWTGANKEIQKKVAKKIVESREKKDTEEGAIAGKYRIEREMFEEEHGEDQKKKEETLKKEREEERKQFEYYLTTLANKGRSLWHGLINLLEFRDILLSAHYQKSREAQDFVYWMAESFSVFRLLMGQDKQGKKFPKNIEATIKMCTEAEGRADEEQRSLKATESLKLLLASKE